jgi:thiamine-phosphate pyrophosphorylase
VTDNAGGPAKERLGPLLAATRLYAVTDDALGPDELVRIVDVLLRAGVRLFQYRDKEHSDRERVTVARTLVNRIHAQGGLLLMNDRADLAVAAGADGVHLGQDDLPLEWGRALVGADRIVGASASYLHEIAPASAVADYLGFGAVFVTGTKPDAEYAGLDLLEQACQASPVPVVGIGGITAERAPAVLGRGAAGVAVVSALFRAPDPPEAARRLLVALNRSI